MKYTEKIICIIDTDPGVDDAAAVCLSLYDDLMDIRLLTSVNGNLNIETVTKNLLHLLEKFNRPDVLVAKGEPRPIKREPKDATFIHQKSGLGFYNPPEKIGLKPIKTPAVEAMYDMIVRYQGNIVIIGLGPSTNIGTLILKHPDVKGMIKHIYLEGCSAFGDKIEGSWKDYISFNCSCDPEALKIVMESGIPITIVASRMGRELANFTEQEVYKIRDTNDVGKFIYQMYSGYWEPTYEDRRIATNDTCAVLAMRFPHLFKTKRAFVEVNCDDKPGATTFHWNRKGNVEYVYKVNRKKMHEYYFKAVQKLERFKFKFED